MLNLKLGHLWPIFHGTVTSLSFSVLVSFSETVGPTAVILGTCIDYSMISWMQSSIFDHDLYFTVHWFCCVAINPTAAILGTHIHLNTSSWMQSSIFDLDLHLMVPWLCYSLTQRSCGEDIGFVMCVSTYLHTYVRMFTICHRSCIYIYSMDFNITSHNCWVWQYFEVVFQGLGLKVRVTLFFFFRKILSLL